MQMRKLVIVAAGLMAMTALSATPAAAHDSPHRHKHHRHHEHRHSSCKTSGTTGLIVGGAAGALLGREIDKSGDRMPGTIIGAGAGALVGREISKKSRC